MCVHQGAQPGGGSTQTTHPASPRTMSWIRPGKMAATDHSRSEAAKQRRQDQLQRWFGSETDRTGSDARETLSVSGTRRAKVRFAQGAVFMAACSAGDREEVAALLRQGADINHANIDGLTALHQVGKLTLLSQLFTTVSPALCQLICRQPSLS